MAHERIASAVDAARRLLERGDLAGAARSYRDVLARDPSHLEALHRLGAIALQGGDATAAEAYTRKALERGGRSAALHASLGNALLGLSSFAQAAEAYERSLQLDPEFVEAHNNRAYAYRMLGRMDDAIASLQTAVRLRPDHAEAHNNLGYLLESVGRADEAIAHCREALRLKPQYPEALNNLGNALRAKGDIVQAVASFREALRLAPGYYEAHNNLGNTLDFAGDVAGAIASYRAALQLSSDNADTHFNFGMLLLSAGRLEEGWREFEWRFNPRRKSPATRHLFPYPEWDGSDLAGKNILVVREQGVGDEIMFASVLPDVIARAKHCVIECSFKLESLFARSFPTAMVRSIDHTLPGWEHAPIAWAEPLGIDCQVAFGSLPSHFRRQVGDFPEHRGYVIPDAERVAEFRVSLKKLGPGLSVGIGWRSRAVAGVKNERYTTTLEQWAPLFAIPGITWVNLQYDQTKDELQRLEKDTGVKVHDLGIDLTDDLDASAALTKACDLVISVETAVSMMAGAVGVPVWQLSLEHSWHTLGTDRTPWFPGMTRFQRGANETWDSVLAKIAPRLASLAQRESKSK